MPHDRIGDLIGKEVKTSVVGKKYLDVTTLAC